MSFTIKCNQCGNEQVFKDEDSRWGQHITIDVETENSYAGSINTAITITCENVTCPSNIDIKI